MRKWKEELISHYYLYDAMWVFCMKGFFMDKASWMIEAHFVAIELVKKMSFNGFLTFKL